MRKRFWWGDCKASVDEAWARAKRWWPHLGRTKTKAIVRRPHHGSRRGFAAYMKEVLPQFKFNSKRDWWEAELEELSHAEKELKPLRLSDGARKYLNEEEAC